MKSKTTEERGETEIADLTTLSSPLHRRASAPRSLVGGVPVDNLTFDQTLDAIASLIYDGRAHYMCVVNASKIALAARDPELHRALSAADLVTADGMSVVWASKLLGTPLAERVTGIDLFERLASYIEAQGLRVYFLGATEASARGAVERLSRENPNLRITGFRNGYFPDNQAERIADEIKASGAEILFVAMGSPRQEKWIATQLIRSGARFALGVGGSFDHVSGLARRAPGWMQHTGLEWLYRLIREPGRMWRRYLIGNTVFIWLVLKQWLRASPR